MPPSHVQVVQKGRSDPRRTLHAVLIANKADLPLVRHAVTQQEGADWAAHNHCTFFQIAAVRGPSMSWHSGLQWG